MESGSASEQTLEKFDDGIMAGDLDSLLEMFEKAETSLSSSAANCLPLTHSKMCGSEEDNMTKLSDQSCISCKVFSEGVTNLDRPSSEPLIRNESSIDAQQVIGGENVDCSMQGDENPCRTFSSNFNREHLSRNTSFEKWETVSNSRTSSSTDAKDTEAGILHTNKARPLVSETFSSSPSVGVTSLKKEDSESSSECDDDFPSDDRYTDSSSGPDTPHRGHGLTVRRDGPRRQQGRGRVKPVEEEKLYDRLPSYYTVFSRPNRMATGLARSSRSCLQLVLKSDLPSADLDSSLNNRGEVFDKVPAYQSCFTNSMRYDETESHSGLDYEKELYIDENARCGRGHGSTSNYLHTRPRFRSRSRLRAEVGPRNRRSGRATLSAFDVTDTTRPGTSPKPENPLQEQHRRILYVGRIPATLTAEGLKAAFEIFGEIEKCTVHFRECGDNYGFVTYANTRDAYSAVEGGTRLQGCENFDICFGGRRNFCKADYFDLDGNVEMEEDFAPVISKMKQKENFDDLLMDELLKRKLQ